MKEVTIKEQVTRREEVKRILLAAHRHYNPYDGYRFNEGFIQYLLELLDTPAKLDEVINIDNYTDSYEQKGV